MVEPMNYTLSSLQTSIEKFEELFPEVNIPSTKNESHVKELKKQILSKLLQRSNSGEGPVNLQGLGREYVELYNMCENTIRHNEGKSILLIGPRGSGKTTLINNIVYDLQKAYPNGFFTIKLNGMIHNDDKSALREIARQLDMNMRNIGKKWGEDVDMEEEEEEADSGSEDYMDEEGVINMVYEKASLDTAMNAVMSILDGAQLNDDDSNGDQDIEKPDRIQIPMVFILEEFDKYTMNAKQSLLYNLFDVAQASSKSPLAIIGVSTKTNVREMLEKRVKSRFSQKIIQITKPGSLEDFCEVVYCCLKADNIMIDGKGEVDEEYANLVNEYNEVIRTMIFNKQFKLRNLIVKNFYTIKDINHLKNILIPMISKLHVQDLLPNEDYLIDKDFINTRSFINVLDSLSKLQLQLLISACTVSMKYTIDQINFNIAYEEYSKNSNRHIKESASGFMQYNNGFTGVGNVEVDRQWSKDVLLLCWEKLIEIGILCEPMRQLNGINVATFTGGEFSKMYLIDVNLEEIRRYFDKRPDHEWVAKWCRLS